MIALDRTTARRDAPIDTASYPADRVAPARVHAGMQEGSE
jgi:hypothetical protein